MPSLKQEIFKRFLFTLSLVIIVLTCYYLIIRRESKINIEKGYIFQQFEEDSLLVTYYKKKGNNPIYISENDGTYVSVYQDYNHDLKIDSLHLYTRIDSNTWILFFKTGSIRVKSKTKNKANKRIKEAIKFIEL